MLGTALSGVEGEERQVDRLLAAALATIAEVPICWVVTVAEDGLDANARAVRDCTGALDGADPWTRWFLAKPGSRKAEEIRRSGRVTLAYQHSSGNAYVALAGRAELLDDRSEVQARLRLVGDPHGTGAAELVAIRVTTERVEIHVRGVTAEPWGHGRTLLERDGRSAWCLVPG